MNTTIDYYFTPQSPWAYLGHEHLAKIAHAAGATIRVMPIDLGGKVFPISGGLPLGQRAPQRQAYRLLELKRYSDHYGLPLNIKPKFFPVPGDDASRLIITVDLHDGADAAMKISAAIFRAVWVLERHIADEKQLAELLVKCGLKSERLEQSFSQTVQERYESNTAQAIVAGVFGAPSYVIGGELFWGQDRLDYVERRLAART